MSILDSETSLGGIWYFMESHVNGLMIELPLCCQLDIYLDCSGYTESKLQFQQKW